MQLELSKEDLLSMVKGSYPSYDIMDNPLIKLCGSYTGGFVDRWNWNHSALEKLSETSLWIVYNMCKQSH